MGRRKDRPLEPPAPLRGTRWFLFSEDVAYYPRHPIRPGPKG